MSAFRTRAAFVVVATALIGTSLSAQAGVLKPVEAQHAGGPAGAFLHVDGRDHQFDIRDFFRLLNRGQHHNRLISEDRARRAANAHTPLRIRNVERQGRTYIVRGFSPRLGRIAVNVDGRTARVKRVDRLGRRHARRDDTRRPRLISATRAARIADAHIDLRVREITLDDRIYTVRGFNRSRGSVVVRVDGETGRVVESYPSRNRTIGRRAERSDNEVNRRTNRDRRFSRDFNR
ncbi:hypothetical protein [Minwuia sp.]|uniref:hypothetical protein n=1 Tax=Minwuia sp. TaxID=2493630 RepID=UPI003A9009AA